MLPKVIGWFSSKAWLEDHLDILSYFIYILKIPGLTGEDANFVSLA